MMGIAAVHFGWRPHEFWTATPHEFWAAFEVLTQKDEDD